MKKTNDRHGNRYGRERRRTGISCLKRVGIIGLSILIAATSETSVTEAFMVRAEEENSKQCVINSFMPLPEDIATQTACTGTELEELQFPDTLEATGSYEEVPDDSGEEKPEEGDTPEKEKPEDEKQPGKPEQDDPAGEDDQDKDKTDEKPGDGEAAPDEPSAGDSADDGQTDEELKEGDQSGGTAEDDNKSPEDQTEDKKPEDQTEDKKPEDQIGDKKSEDQKKDKEPENPEENINPEDQKEEEKKDGESAGSAASEGEAAPENLEGEEPSGDKSKETDQSGITGDGTASAEAEGTARVYVDMLDDILSAVEDKVVALFDHVTVEENEIMLASNMAEAEQEADVQILTQIVSVEPVTWDCISEYDSEMEGCYVFMPVLPEGYVLADGVAVPEIVVIISGQEIKSSIQAQKKVSVFADEEALTSGICGSGVNWSYDSDTGTLTITGNGAMYDFSDLNTPWRAYQGEITNIEIGNGVTSIGSYAFFKCSSLSAVSIPGSVASIGEAAFFECSSLNGITIPGSVTSIGGSAFFNCSKLSKIEIPSGSTVDSLAFYGCSGVTYIEVPTGATVTPAVFSGCTSAFLYYPKSQSALGATEGTRANIAYAVAGGNTSLEIARVAGDLDGICFPDSVGGGTVWESNWSAYKEAVKITHNSYPDHRYADGSKNCAICGYEKAPEIRIDYINEKLTGFEPGKAYSYSIPGGDSGTLDADADRTLDIKEMWLGKTISIVVQENGQSAGNAQTFTIPERDPAPDDVMAEGEIEAGKGGKLSGVSPKMEYSTHEDTGYNPVEGDTVEGLTPGTYYVRYKAVAETSDTNGSFHSLPVEVIVEAHKLTPEDTPEAEIDYKEAALIHLAGRAEYRIKPDKGAEETIVSESDGSKEIAETWFGKTIYIIKTGDGVNKEDSAAQDLFIPSRPDAPANIGKIDASAGKEDGSLTKVSSDMEYRLAGADTWTSITGNTVDNRPPGKYEIRFKAKPSEKKFASKIAEVTIASANREKEDKPSAGIDFEKETLTKLRAGQMYRINDDEIPADADGTISLTEWIGSTIRIVKVGDQVYKDDSDAQPLNIPARPSAPEQVAAEPASAANARDGKLVNTENTMQFRREADEVEDNEEEETEVKWESVSGKEVTGLTPGIYFIRIGATKESFHSDEVERIIQVKDAELEPEPQPAASINYETEKLTNLKQNAKYAINDLYGNALTDEESVNADKNGEITIDESWMGTDIYIVKVGNQFTMDDSEPQQLPIHARRPAPADIMAYEASKKDAKDGKLAPVDHTMQYRKEGVANWTTVPQGKTELTGLSPGVYHIRYRADQANEDFASLDAAYTINARVLQPEDEFVAYISFADECFYSLESDAFYKINGTKIKADENGAIKIKSAWMTGKAYKIVKAGDNVTTSDSPPYSITVPKKRPAPSGIKAVSESEIDANDGKLTGVNDDMEYRPAGGEWMNVYGDTVEPLAPGKYEIRLTYTDSEFSSKSVTKTIYAYGKEPKAPAQDKKDDKETEGTEGEQSDESGGQGGSSQDGGSSGGGAAGSTDAGSKAAGVRKNGQQTVTAAPVSESQAKVDARPDQDKKEADGRFNGTAIADFGKDGSDSNGNAGNGRQSGKTGASAQGEGDGLEAIQKQTDTETDTEAVKAGYGQYSTDSAVYTERARGRMSEFYNFVLELADSRNPGWIAVILAEPLVFLLIMIYLLGRKNREKECQAGH